MVTDRALSLNQQPKVLDLSCRLYVEGNREALIALWVASWQETMPAIDFDARRDWFAAHLKKLEGAGFETICAFDPANILLGFVTLNSQTHELDQLAVTPSAWGSGVAPRLITEARRLSPHALVLDVNVHNPRAVRFYEREGFSCVGEGINAISGLKTLRMRWQPGREV
jgi:putative acetyltransferase